MGGPHYFYKLYVLYIESNYLQTARDLKNGRNFCVV